MNREVPQDIREALDDASVRISQEVPKESGYFLVITETEHSLFEIEVLDASEEGDNRRVWVGESTSFEGAWEVVKTQAQFRLTEVEGRDRAEPDASQLLFLFRHKIPIAPDLTQGRAALLIGREVARMAELAHMEMAEQARHEAEERERVRQRHEFNRRRLPVGVILHHNTLGDGEILMNNGEVVLVRFGDGEKLLSIEHCRGLLSSGYGERPDA